MDTTVSAVMSWIAQQIVSAIQFVFNTFFVKLIVLTALFVLMEILLPLVKGFLAPFIGIDSLTSAFSGLGDGVGFWLQFFAIDAGLPMVLSAYVARFLIRRIPFIG